MRSASFRSVGLSLCSAFLIAGVIATVTLKQPLTLQSRVIPVSNRPAPRSVFSMTRPAITVSNITNRMQKRIHDRFGFNVSKTELTRAINEQRKILSSSTAVDFVADGSSVGKWIVGVGSSPMWLTVDVSPMGMRSGISEVRVAEELSTMLPSPLKARSEDSTVTDIFVENDIQKVHTQGIAKPGYNLDLQKIAHDITFALTTKSPQIQVSADMRPGKILAGTGIVLEKMELLSTGKSNFEGSGNGRKANVRKGLNQYLANTLVAPGEDFSFNAVLKNVPMSEWEMALGIFNGHELRPVAGGGLCQVATTFYRAILNGGFPVTKRANHSLFVHYYEKYGVGIDATVFIGSQDLRFINDTGHTLLIQSYTEGDEARVMIYGTPDGRSVTMNGPYFSVNAPKTLQVNGRDLRSNEIVWEQQIRYADGRTESHTVLSRYKSIPRIVVKEYTAPVKQEISYLP